MKNTTRWFGFAMVFALVAGFLRDLHLFLPLSLADHDVSSRMTGVVLLIVSLITALASPIGTFLTGCLWGGHENARFAYKRFSIAVYGSAIVGFVGGHLAGRGPVFSGLEGLHFFGTHILGLVDVALAALAGVAVGYFRFDNGD